MIGKWREIEVDRERQINKKTGRQIEKSHETCWGGVERERERERERETEKEKEKEIEREREKDSEPPSMHHNNPPLIGSLPLKLPPPPCVALPL